MTGIEQPGQADIEAARLLLAKMGIRPADLLRASGRSPVHAPD